MPVLGMYAWGNNKKVCFVRIFASSKNQFVPFNESTSKKEAQNTALTAQRTWESMVWFLCLSVCSVFILFSFARQGKDWECW